MAKRARLTATKNMRAPKPKAGEKSSPRLGFSADMKMTTIYITAEMLTLLRIVAARRAEDAGGGRPSVSDVVRGILEKYRSEIEDEALQ